LKKIVISFAFLLFLISACNNSENNQVNENKDSLDIKKSGKELTNDSVVISKSEQNNTEEEDKLAMLHDNEKVLFSFKTNKGKIMNIILDKDEKYMAYRFGTEKKVELQFPEKLVNTFEQFTYSYYFRGGGAMNMGLDLNYLSFNGETHQFVVYDEWSAGENEDEEGAQSVGIKIIDLTTKKEIIIEGLSSTVNGSLIDFRDNGLIKVEEGEM